MLHYTTHIKDSSADWVTFVHGAGGSSTIWYRQIRAFSKEFNVLLIDLRGHGKSKTHDQEELNRYNFATVGDDIIEVMDHLGIEASHFIGISLGTIIIREISERYSDRVKSMIMGGAIMRLNLRGQFLMYFGVLIRSLVPYIWLYSLLAFILMPRKRHSKSRNLFINEAKKLSRKEFMKWFGLVAEINPLLAKFRAKDNEIKTLYIMGDEDYMFLPTIKKLVKKHSKSELSIVSDSGHVVNVDQANNFNQKAIQFLKSLSPIANPAV